MIRYLTHEEVQVLHRWALEQSGGLDGIRDPNGLDSAIAQPQMTFAGQELYPSLAEKAAALGFSLVSNHPFLDGNKRIGYAAMETFLFLNGWVLDGEIDEQEQLMLQLAAGVLSREQLIAWVQAHLQPRPTASESTPPSS
jgi:death-on-curing protein